MLTIIIITSHIDCDVAAMQLYYSSSISVFRCILHIATVVICELQSTILAANFEQRTLLQPGAY